MKLLVISSAPVFSSPNDLNLHSYSPFVKEMNMWFQNFKEVSILAPAFYPNKVFTSCFERNDLNLIRIPFLDFRTFFNASVSFFKIFVIYFKLFQNIYKYDHIHIRCPGNVGLVALLVLIFYPSKHKTIKYAGNWDPESFQPFSYRIQKWLLNHPWIIQNKKVLVYGKWKNQLEHVISFFTATYSENEKIYIKKNQGEVIRFVFCGNLVSGKNPLLAVKIIQVLLKKNHSVVLDIYGDGLERRKIQDYIKNYKLTNKIYLHGNRNKDVLKEAYINSHFCILPSKSEGWPKAIAEGMFFGCVPIATKVSCVPWMFGDGERGILIDSEVEHAVLEIEEVLFNSKKYNRLSEKARRWSEQYTTEKFEKAIFELL